MKGTTQNETPVDFQIPVDRAPRQLWDALIVGAGPAGCAAAYQLSRRGHSVLLLDMARFPRDKTCGDCMITDAADCLQRMELTAEIERVGSRLSGISIFSPSGINFDIPGRFVTVKRRLFDTILARRAVESGATFVSGRVINMRPDNGANVAAEIKAQTRPVIARFAVIATGAHIGLARRLGAITSEKPSAIAGRCYVRSGESLSKLVLVYDRRILPGYGWIVPLGNNEYNIGCGYFLRDKRRMDIRRCFAAFTSEFPLARKLVSEGEILSPLKSAPLRCALKGALAVVGENILLAGETFGTTFVITGEGIGQAMISGELAASAIHRALADGDNCHIREYPAAITSRLKSRHDGFVAAQKWVSNRWLNDFMAARVKRSAYLRDACTAFATDGGDPRRVYSVGAILRSFVK